MLPLLREHADVSLQTLSVQLYWVSMYNSLSPRSVFTKGQATTVGRNPFGNPTYELFTVTPKLLLSFIFFSYLPIAGGRCCSTGIYSYRSGGQRAQVWGNDSVDCRVVWMVGMVGMVGMVVREMKEFSFYNLCSTRRCKFTRHRPVFVVTGPVYVPFQKYNKLSTVNVQT